MQMTGLKVLGSAIALVLPAAAMAGPLMIVAELDGAGETDGGDADGTGSFVAEIDAKSGDVCYELTVANVGTFMSAHIHEGAAGVDGKPVVNLELTEDGDLCVAAEPDALKPIVSAPANYYVNVHTSEHPKGAVRGQLSKAKD